MIKKSILAVVLVIVVVGLMGGWQLQREADRVASDDPTVWESAIVAFADRDRENPPPENTVLFLGSSSIRFWGDDLQRDLGQFNPLGRGFGGAKINDLAHYADRLITPYQPRAIVLYIGANDLSGAFGGQFISNDEAERRYRDLLQAVENAAPDTPVYILALKPTRRSADRWPIIQSFNERLEQLAAEASYRHYLDANAAFWNESGEVRSEALMFDGMHLSREGYRLWAGEIGRRLDEDGF